MLWCLLFILLLISDLKKLSFIFKLIISHICEQYCGYTVIKFKIVQQMPRQMLDLQVLL